MVSVASFVTFPHNRDKERLGHVIIHTNDKILKDKSHVQVGTLSSAREVGASKGSESVGCKRKPVTSIHEK